MDRMSSVPLYECHDFGNINKFHLLLGPACNMCCRHCSQTDEKTVKRFGKNITDKVWQTLKNYMVYSKDCAIDDVFCPTRKIIFWGGEALLHWDLIKDIVTCAKKEVGFTCSSYFQFSIISNGLLLTQDKVDFINENRIGFCFSYDAPYPFAIRDYVSNDICKLVRKIKRYGVHCSSNAINDDQMLGYRCLQAKFPDSVDIDINPNLMQAPGIPKDIYDWNWENIKRSVRKVRIASQMGDSFAINLINRYWFNVGVIKNHKNYASVEACSIGNKLLNCTPNGEVLACYNSFDRIGTIDDSLLKLHEVSKERLQKKVSPDCKDCRHLDICRGNRCWVNAQNEKHQFYGCHNYWFKFYDILKSELLQLSKPLSNEDKAWYQEQEKVMNAQVQDFLKKYN